ncbi:YceI family protein [Dyadobacter sp. CY327]|uniref:YceI family protein n=1 Tax=Dyadobacter sp. CY327 TaxID=2907301 RepID=UPI001F28F206|nr:YceI family protein [Dyadobacter sp. CY327]MCE7071893.1 YceI family protein [Dyadobacter sp. CY327]
MNKKHPLSYLILFIVLFFFGCHGTVKEEKKNNVTASSVSLHVGNEKYVAIDTKESVVTWRGYNLNGLNSQTGYVYISKGELLIENGELTGGTVEVDMNTIEDKNHGRDNKLVHHLKDPDFFEVERFPFSTIAITRVTSLNEDIKKLQRT